MLENKKELYYYIRPSLFFDLNNTNEGDFEGLKSKKDYFKKFNIDNVIFPNLFKMYDVKIKNDLKKVFESKGYLESLSSTIKFFKENNIKVGVKLDISDIDNDFRVYSKIKDFYQSGKNTTTKITNEFYLIEKKSSSIKSNNSKFKSMITFYSQMGFNFFIFENLETFLAKNHEDSEKRSRYLNSFKSTLKKIDLKAKIFGEIDFANSKQLLEVQKMLIFEKIFISNLSYIGIKNNKKHFANWKKSMKNLRLNKLDNFVILTLNNENFGWFFSRNGKENLYLEKAIKSFFMFQTLIKNDFLIFSGEEIGSLRSNNINFNEIISKTWLIQKMNLKNDNWSKKNIEDYRNFIHPTNIKTVFSWNSQQNAGFNKNLDSKINKAFKYKQNNLEILESDKSSIWNFYLLLLRLIKNKKMIDIMNNYKYKISYKIFNKNLLIFSFKNKKERIKIILNFSAKSTKLLFSNKYKILVTTYENKKYLEKTKFLDGFESVVIIKNIDMKF